MRGAVRFIFFVMLFFACITGALAQKDDCEQTLDRAFDEFSNGHFYTIPAILDPCIRKFSREQTQRAYLLLTQAYLLLDDPIGAKQSYLSLLKANPEFVTDTATHSIDVIYLSKRFTATSIFSWFAKAGTNLTIPRIINDLSAFGESGVQEKNLVRAGYQVGLGGDLNFTEQLNLRIEAQYIGVSLRNETRSYWEQDFKQVTETQSWFSAPLTIAYNDAYGKYRPYTYAGYGFHYLIGSRSSIFLRNNRPQQSPSGQEGARENTTVESTKAKNIYQRNRFNHSAIVGAGVKMKLGLDFLFVDLRYNFGLKNITSKDGLYGDYSNERPESATSSDLMKSFSPTMAYANVNDYMRLDNLSLSFGFLHPLYKPRELKRARTKSVMRKMNR